MENLHTVDSLQSEFEERSNVGEDRVDEECEVLVAEPEKKRQKKGKSKEIKVAEEDNKRNWLDSEVEALIALKGEMQPEFIKNAKKQGMEDLLLRFFFFVFCSSFYQCCCLVLHSYVI